LVTDSSKNIVSAVTYHPFGEPSTAEGQEHYLYTGKQKDATGLYYYGARFYDPGVGRFLTRDPKGGINRYSYCLNNPLKNIDPDGCESTNWIDGEPWNQESGTVPIPGHAHIPDFVTWTREDKEGNWALAYWFFAILAIVTAPIWLPAVLAGVASLVAAEAAKLAAIVAIEALSIILYWVIQNNKGADELPKMEISKVYDDEGNEIGYQGSYEEAPGRRKGKVILYNDPDDPNDDTEYEYRYYGGGFQVWINGEWVQMDEEWKPGQEIPSQA
jgi:RHS repeat-associated protein